MQDQNNNQDQRLEQFYKLESPPKEKKKGRKGLKIWIIVIAVSYTHLDVYKRQRRPCPENYHHSQDIGSLGLYHAG